MPYGLWAAENTNFPSFWFWRGWGLHPQPPALSVGKLPYMPWDHPSALVYKVMLYCPYILQYTCAFFFKQHNLNACIYLHTPTINCSFHYKYCIYFWIVSITLKWEKNNIHVHVLRTDLYLWFVVDWGTIVFLFCLCQCLHTSL